jgi:hypothetical protein
MNYNKLILKIKKNKYQNYLNLNKKFYLSYVASRLITIEKLESKRIIKGVNKSFKSKNNKIFSTFNYLYLIFQKFNKTKNIGKKDLKIIYLLYKKFETNLILRENYDKNFIKISKKETNLNSYILLSFLIKKLNNIDYLQKINFLVKINDHLIINKFIPKGYEIRRVFIKNIKHEIDSVHKLNEL